MIFDFETINQDIENRTFVLSVLAKLTPDPEWSNHIVDNIVAGNPDIRTILSYLAKTIKPKIYLEVGVRRGFSLATVVARCPDLDVYGFDTFKPNGEWNKGSDFVRKELQNIGYNKEPNLIEGDSHITIRNFYRNHDLQPDLVLIDGDHSLLGAWQDLTDVVPKIRPGGALVFDDIAPDPTIDLSRERGEDLYDWQNLLGVWHRLQKEYVDFDYYEWVQTPPGVGVAIRKELS